MIDKFKAAIKRELALDTTCDTLKYTYNYILKDLDDKKWIFDPTDAIARIKFIERYLKHTGLELGGKPLKLLFFQKFLILCTYGFYNQDKSLRFKRVFLTCGRQNGKSLLIAALQICHLIFDRERFKNQINGIFYSSSYKQAHDLYKKAFTMIKDADLEKFLGLQCLQSYIRDYSERNILKPITTSFKTADGMRSTFLAGDEVATARNSNLSLVLKSGIIQKKNAIEMLITTASTDSNSSYGYSIYSEYKKQLESGTVPEHCLPMIFEPNEKDKPDNPLTWKRANPLLTAGVFKEHEFRQAYIDSEKSIEEGVSFKTKTLNQYASSSDSFLEDEEITDAIQSEPYTFNPLKQVFIGIDDTIKKDLGAITILQFNDGLWYADTTFFAPRTRIDHMVKRVRSPYYVKAYKEGKLVAMGDSIKDSNLLMDYFKNNYINKYDTVIKKIVYDNASFSADVFNELKSKFASKFCTDTIVSKTRMATHMTQSVFKKRQIKINPNSMMRYSLSCGYYTIGAAGYMQIVRKDLSRENDGLMSLLYAYSGVFASNIRFYLDQFGPLPKTD